MRIAILSESSADEAALRILVDAVLGVKSIPIATELRSRGWSAVQANLLAVAKYLHYRTNADGLVVVVDSNHTYLSIEESKNRLKQFQELAERCRKQLNPLPGGRIPLKIAIGVAAPAIEAWWLCQTDSQISEAAWERGLNDRRDPYSKQELKKRLYSQDYSSLDWMTQKMIEAAQSVIGNLAALEKNFPSGYGSLANELRRWRRIG